MTSIKGIQRKVEEVEIEVNSQTLLHASFSGMNDSDLVSLVRNRLRKVIIKHYPELQGGDLMMVTRGDEQTWFIEDGYDYHKGEELYRMVRPVTEQEALLLSLADTLAETLNLSNLGLLFEEGETND